MTNARTVCVFVLTTALAGSSPAAVGDDEVASVRERFYGLQEKTPETSRISEWVDNGCEPSGTLKLDEFAGDHERLVSSGGDNDGVMTRESFYFDHGALYFAFVSVKGSGPIRQDRYYFDAAQHLVRHLRRVVPKGAKGKTARDVEQEVKNMSETQMRSHAHALRTFAKSDPIEGAARTAAWSSAASTPEWGCPSERLAASLETRILARSCRTSISAGNRGRVISVPSRL